MQLVQGLPMQPKFEQDFQHHSYGFRPKRNARQALRQSLDYINQGQQHIVDIDLKSLFDHIKHYILLESIYKQLKYVHVLKLIRQFLRAPL